MVNANAPTNPDIGHFHVYGEEFWFVIEGTVGFLKEGSPYSFAERGRYHLQPADALAQDGDPPWD